MDGRREFLEGSLDGHRWRATWDTQVPDSSPPTRRVWRVAVDDHATPLVAAKPIPIEGSEVCRAEIEVMIRVWLGERGDDEARASVQQEP